MYINLRQALGAVDAARDLGLDIPAAIQTAVDVRHTVLTAGRTSAGGTPTIPATPGAAHKALVDHGRNLMTARYTGQAAADMSKHVDAVVVRAVTDAAPTWITELGHLYDAAAHRLTEDLTGVPSHVEQRVGHIPRPVFASWLRCESAADNLDRIVECRNKIASAAGEEPIKNRRLLASITFPPPGDGRTWTQHHAPVLADWHDALKRPVERWRHLVRHDGFDLVLAALGEVHRRAEVRDQWRHRAQIRHGRFM